VRTFLRVKECRRQRRPPRGETTAVAAIAFSRRRPGGILLLRRLGSRRFCYSRRRTRIRKSVSCTCVIVRIRNRRRTALRFTRCRATCFFKSFFPNSPVINKYLLDGGSPVKYNTYNYVCILETGVRGLVSCMLDSRSRAVVERSLSSRKFLPIEL